MKSISAAAACAVSLLALSACDSAEEKPTRGMGVVVESVGRGSTLEEAGVEGGDLLLAWERPPNPLANPHRDRGELASPFDWRWLVTEQAPRGTILLRGQRSGEDKVFEVVPGYWKARVRPRLPPERLEEYSAGQDSFAAGDMETAVGWWEKIATVESDPAFVSWMLVRIGEAWTEVRAWEKAHSSYRSALDASKAPGVKAWVWEAMGDAYGDAGQFDKAAQSYASAQRVVKRLWGEKSLCYAETLLDMGNAARRRGAFSDAVALYGRALAIQQELAPDSIVVAATLNSLGTALYNRGGDPEEAARYFQQSLKIRQVLAPDSLSVADLLNNLGVVARRRGDLVQATELQEQALEIRQKWVPWESPSIAASLTNLGNLARQRGDLDQAARNLERALEIAVKIAPDSLIVADSLNNLGSVAGDRGDLDRAAHYFQRAMEIWQRLTPGSPDVALGFNNLGMVAWDRGDLEAAFQYHKQALEIRQKLAPGSLDAAVSLNHLGNVVELQGEPDRAAELHRQAMAIQQGLAPASLDLARSLNGLGSVAEQQGDLELAVQYHEESLRIRRRLAPGSTVEAQTFYALAALRRKQNQTQEALALLRHAMGALEEQVERLGGSHGVQAGFRARYGIYYRHAIELLLAQGHRNEAFQILERFRAQTFLAQLAERDLVFTSIPAPLSEKRRRLAVQYDQVQRELARLSVTQDEGELRIVEARLHELHRERDDVEAAIRRASPELASLRYPEPLDVEAARRALDPGTVMLSYSVGENLTDLFCVTREEGLVVKTLSIGEAELWRDVEALRQLINTKRSPGPPRFPTVLSKRLFRTLIGPVADPVERSDRVLIVPDGPLHLLPFAALIRNPTRRDEEAEGQEQYLAEWKPLHMVLSATVYSQLRTAQLRSVANRGEAPAVQLVGFGDPVYGDPVHLEEGQNEDWAVRGAQERGHTLAPLPGTRREVEQISKLYPRAQIYLGKEATEERVKSVSGSLRTLHLAAHGTLDSRFPLSSAVALTPSGGTSSSRDNGLLQAWEIFEQMRLDADLVVLSACDSGQGRLEGGDGLVGLIRAFQYAGARSVAATQWRVEDYTTAELMTRFHRYLSAGKPKDEALQASQIDLIRAPILIQDEKGRTVERDRSAPYYWASFQIHGYWQ